MPLTVDDIDDLYRRHARAMVTFFARRTLDAEVAVDLVAETFAIAIAQRRRCRGRTDPERSAWLYGIARHQLQLWYRSGAIERRALARVGLERPALTDADVERIEELGALAELRGRVAAGLGGLSTELRAAVWARIVEERSYPEVAARLGIAEPAARARVSRALRALRDQLDDEELEEARDA